MRGERQEKANDLYIACLNSKHLTVVLPSRQIHLSEGALRQETRELEVREI